jgi:hypothetical protein
MRLHYLAAALVFGIAQGMAAPMLDANPVFTGDESLKVAIDVPDAGSLGEPSLDLDMPEDDQVSPAAPMEGMGLSANEGGNVIAEGGFPNVVVVPEPFSLSLIGTGLLALGLVRRKGVRASRR